MTSRIAAITIPLLLATACQITGPGEGIQESRDPIVGGQATSSLPAVGVILRNGSTHCTGTVVSPRKVVTAAHCLKGYSASSMSFGIGPTSSQLSTVIAVSSITPHPQYNSNSLTHDIGYITLSKDAPVEPMPILPEMDSSWVGSKFIFVGYGVSNGFSQTGAGVKRFVEMPVAQVGATQFSYDVANMNTCNGDSGGPAFAQVNNQLFVAGVTSYGDANCVQYGVDTRVDVYADFLDISVAPPPAPTDPCNGETFEGRCDGDTVIWCENAKVQSQTCDASKVCGYNDAKQYYGCIEPPPVEPPDPCNGETYEGRCDGNTVIWCENEEVKTIQCAQCGFDAGKGFFNCM